MNINVNQTNTSNKHYEQNFTNGLVKVAVGTAKGLTAGLVTGVAIGYFEMMGTCNEHPDACGIVPLMMALYGIYGISAGAAIGAIVTTAKLVLDEHVASKVAAATNPNAVKV